MSVKVSISPFQYADSINKTKTDLMVDDIAEKQYAPWIVNKSLAYFADTVLFANDMNMNYHLDHKLQYHYLINSVRPRNRYEKWVKAEKNSDLDAIREYYKYSHRKALTALSLLNNDQINEIKKKNNKGGLK